MGSKLGSRVSFVVDFFAIYALFLEENIHYTLLVCHSSFFPFYVQFFSEKEKIIKLIIEKTK